MGRALGMATLGIPLGVGSSGAAAAFSPADLSPALWLKADAGLYQSPGVYASGAAVADGDPVGEWQDQSGNGRHVTQAAGSPKPTLKLAIQNGLAVVRFDGVDDHLASSAFSQTEQYTLAAVVKSTAAGIQCVMDADGGAAPRLWQFRYENNTNFQTIAFDTTPSAFTDAQAITAAQFNLIVAVRGATSVETWVNNTSGGSTATTGTPNSGSKAVYVGAFSTGGANFLTGDIGELLLIPSALSTADRESLQTYLKARWGTP